jgi:hypothetical protein
MFRDYEKFGNTNLVKSLQIGKRYEEHENNFKELMDNKKPGEIDFSENADEPIGNMDNALSQKMENRDAELNNITKGYDTNDSIQWLNGGGVPKLKIHEKNLNLKIHEPTTPPTTLVNPPIKPIKKVKFHMDNASSNTSGNTTGNAANDNANDNSMEEYFNLLNDNMNKDVKKKEVELASKMNIMKEVDRRDALKGEKKDINLDNLFNNMRVKTKDSDINAAKSQTDIVNVNKRFDKIETYLFDIMNNQIKILEKIDNMNILP